MDLYRRDHRLGGDNVRLGEWEASRPQAVGDHETELRAMAAPAILWLSRPAAASGGAAMLVGECPDQVALDGVDAAGTVRLQRRISHDVAGLAELDRILAAQTGALKVAIERAEGLLVEHLLVSGVALYCLSPKIAARARECYRLWAAKSDALDAFVLADTLRHEHGYWRPLSRPSPLLAELRALTRDRRRVVHAQ